MQFTVKRFHDILQILTQVGTELPFFRHSSWISEFYIPILIQFFEFYVT